MPLHLVSFPPCWWKQRFAVTIHITSERLNRRDQHASVRQLDKSEAYASEEVELNEQNQLTAPYAGQEKMLGRRKKLSARNDVQDLINEMDPASCGPAVQTAEVPYVIIRLWSGCGYAMD